MSSPHGIRKLGAANSFFQLELISFKVALNWRRVEASLEQES